MRPALDPLLTLHSSHQPAVCLQGAVKGDWEEPLDSRVWPAFISLFFEPLGQAFHLIGSAECVNLVLAPDL